MNSSNSEQFRHILVIEDRKARRIVTLEDSTYSIGRDAKNIIVLYDNQVSRHHATLLRIIDYKTNQSLYRILDGDLQGKRSTNGLIINGKTCLSHELKHGDIIRFGGKAKATYHVFSSSSPDFDLLKAEEKTTIQKAPILPNKDEESKKTLSFNPKELEQLTQEELVRLASFPEFSPNPIIEIDWQGNLTYLNSAASLRFKEIQQSKLEHPILTGLLSNSQSRQGGLFVREVKIGSEVFEQYVHYLSDAKLIRSYIFDYTKRKQSEIALKESEERYQLPLEQISEGIAIVDVNTYKILVINAAYSQLLGYDSSEISTLTLGQIIEFNQEVIEKQLASLGPSKKQLTGPSVYKRKDGSYLEVKVKVSLTSYQGKEVYCFVVSDTQAFKGFQDTNQYYNTVYDSLTGLPNRTLFLEHLATAIANAKRHHDLIALLLVEISFNPILEEPLPEEQHTEILKTIGQSLRNSLRAGDTIARWDKRHFIILLPRIYQAKDIQKIASRILSLFQENTEEFTVNIGIAVYPVNSDDINNLLKNSLEALEMSKQEPGNNYSFHKTKATANNSNLLKLENHLRKALDKNQFLLYYQPLININDQTITGLKASLYWQHPELGLIPPEKYYSLAEKTDLIVAMNDWMLQTTCQQNKIWQTAILAPIPVSIDLATKQFQKEDLVTRVATILENNQLDSDLLELNINTDCINSNESIACQNIEELLKIGVKISLQDFGKGPSFLNYLQRFQFYRLKINSSLVKDLGKSLKNQPIIAAAITLGNGLKMKVVAEGVETQEQVEILQRLNCDEIQGSWFSQPLTSEEATKLLQSISNNSV